MANTTWNPADLSSVTLSGGNLIATAAAATCGVRAVDKSFIGKLYWEATIAFPLSANIGVGIANINAVLSTAFTAPNNVSYLYNGTNSSIYVNSGTPVGNLGITLATGNTVSVAVDLNAARIWYRLAPAGNWNGSSSNDPATNVGGFSIASMVSGGSLAIYPGGFFGGSGTRTITANFGTTAFSGAVPSGFVAGFPVGGVVASSPQGRVMVMA